MNKKNKFIWNEREIMQEMLLFEMVFQEVTRI